MAIVSIHEAEANLSDLIARAEAGEEIVIARDSDPVVVMSAVAKSPAKRPIFGALKGKFAVPPDAFFFDPLPDEELRLWEGEGEPPSR